MIVFLSIGMIKYFVKDFIRVYMLDKQMNEERFHSKYEEEKYIIDYRENQYIPYEHEDQIMFERQERQENKTGIENENSFMAKNFREKDTNHVQFHRYVLVEVL